MTSKDDPNRIEKQAHAYAEYEAQDQKGEPVGHVDDLFVDTVNGQEYVELNMGALGLRSTIVPLEICTVDEEHKIVVIPQSRTKLKRAPRKRAPLLGDEVMAITPEYEDRIRAYFGLEPVGPPTEERPFRAFSTAYPSGDETPRGEVHPVEARIIDRRPVEPEPARSQAVDESGETEVSPQEPRTVEPDAIEAQDAESVEPEVVAVQDPEAAGSETAESQEATEPEAIDLAAAEDETSDVRVVEPAVLEAEGAEADVTIRVEGEGPAPVEESEADAAGASDADALSEEAETPEAVEDALDADEQASQPAGEEVAPLSLTASTQEVETARQRMTEATRQSFQAIADRAVKAQESNLDLSRSIAQSFVEQLQSQTQGNRQATETLQQQGQRQQQALQAIVQGSVSAYTNLLTSTFSVYQQTLQTATRIALGNMQAATRLTQQAAASASGAQQGVQAAQQGIEATGQTAAQQGSGETGQE